MKPSDKWRLDLDSWGIRKEILDQAPESPWIHPPAVFALPPVIKETISHQRAVEALDLGGSILDIGCGGGIAAFAAVPPAALVIGVDHQSEMLEMFSDNASARGVKSETIEGFWPAVADVTPVADVVTCHHVVYNVGEIVPFLQALDSHARKRVVLEMPTTHPRSNQEVYWKHFWNEALPSEPTHLSLVAVLKEIGIAARYEVWNGELGQDIDLAQAAHFMRIRLCLPQEREAELLEFMKSQPVKATREIATIWWDKAKH